jgi:aminoglycoside phosphotransferase family enzyme
MVIPACQAEAAAFLTQLVGGAPVETHISAVFLGEGEAYKLKKAVDFGFLDFTTLAERERLTKFENALNALHAPGLYLGALPLTRGPDGALRVGGDGPAVEWVLCMKRLPPAAFFPGPVPAELLDPLDAAAWAGAMAQLLGGGPRLAASLAAARRFATPAPTKLLRGLAELARMA